MISCQRAVTALTVNNVLPYQLAIGCSDSTVRLYDRRMLRIGFGKFLWLILKLLMLLLFIINYIFILLFI